MKEGTTENRNGMAFKSETDGSKKKPLDKIPHVWYNSSGKGQPKASSKSRGTARGSMVETFTGCHFHTDTHTHTNTNEVSS